MNKDTSRQWKHLGLILHPSEWRREYQSVIVALELEILGDVLVELIERLEPALAQHLLHIVLGVWEKFIVHCL